MEPILDIQGKKDAEISNLFSHYSVALTPDEGRQVADLLGRNPTLTEATVWGIQGSEHSSYKSSRNHLKKLPVKSKEILLGVGEDAGVIHFHTTKEGRQYGICMAHESHNHPSQVVPYEGAATGVGGISRDILCMGARVIGALDALRFGDLNSLEQKRIFSGVTEGVGGYGNPLGVPNLGGDMRVDDSFSENCLVNVVAIGMLDFSKVIHSYVPKNAEGYDFILVGKATDRSGFGGSSFASAVLDEGEKEKNKGAVQEPNPFLERHLFAAFGDLFKRLDAQGDLQDIALKDLGAGGVLCATVELIAETGFGAEVSVDDIHIDEEDLPAAVILCAETQERFCLAVPPRLTEMVLEHFNTRWDLPGVSSGARASKIGKVISGGVYQAKHQGEMVCDAKATDITEGIVVDRPMTPREKSSESLPDFSQKLASPEVFLELLRSPNICSNRPYTETYDQTVQGKSILLRDQTEAVSFAPLRDFSDLSPEEQELKGVISVAGSARIGLVSPRSQGKQAVLQSVLKVSASGGVPLALTDCLNYGNPEVPEQMWELSEGMEGIGKMARSLNLAFVGGNVSLYNVSPSGSVSPSSIIACVGKIPENTLPRPNGFQKKGSSILVLGERSGNLGGSEFLRLQGFEGRDLPEYSGEKAAALLEVLHSSGNRLLSAAVIEEGGLALTLLRMSARGKLGGNFTADFSPEQWISEDMGVVLEVSSEEVSTIKALAREKDVFCQELGVLDSEEKISVGNKENFSITNISEIYWGALRRQK